MIEEFRSETAAAQAKAGETLGQNGIKVVVPPKEELAQSRQRMLATQDELIKELKLDPTIVAKINATLSATN
jgi:hypothetical protein